MNKVEVVAALTCLGNEIDYPNFKSKIGKTEDQRDKLDAYTKSGARWPECSAASATDGG